MKNQRVDVFRPFKDGVLLFLQFTVLKNTFTTPFVKTEDRILSHPLLVRVLLVLLRIKGKIPGLREKYARKTRFLFCFVLNETFLSDLRSRSQTGNF